MTYFDITPANLNPLPVKTEAAKFVGYMGSEMMVKKEQADFANGEYRFVAIALTKVMLMSVNFLSS